MYNIIYSENASKFIKGLNLVTKKRLGGNIKSKLLVEPTRFGKPLVGSLKGHRRLRVGNYRIVYKIKGKIITVVAIGDRKNIYG